MWGTGTQAAGSSDRLTGSATSIGASSATGNASITTANGILGTNKLATSPLASINYTADLHNGAGNVGMADGSVQQVTKGKLQDLGQATGDPSGGNTTGNRIVVPQ